MPMQLSTVLDMLVSVILAGEIAAAALIDARERRFPHALSVLLGWCMVVYTILPGMHWRPLRSWRCCLRPRPFGVACTAEPQGSAGETSSSSPRSCWPTRSMRSLPLSWDCACSPFAACWRDGIPCLCCRSSPSGVRSSRSLLCFRETGPCFVRSVCNYKRMKSREIG